MQDVSVPLRGYGFEILIINDGTMIIRDGFRPLAGIWF